MSELEEYQQQLQDLEETLANDPQNESLLALKAELVELIALLEPEAKDEKNEKNEPDPDTQPEPETLSHTHEISATPEPQAKHLVAGELVWARTKLDKQIKQARVITVAGNHKTVTITFTESNTTETYPVEEVHKEKPKDLANKYKKQQLKAAKPKDEKYEQALNKSAQSWQSFNKKTKKVKKSSQFSTSDVVGSRVGITGSGKPMTVEKKKKARYSPY